MGCDSLFLVNHLGPLSDDIAQGGVAQFLLNLTAVGVFCRLEEKVILRDLAPNPIHPRDILVNVMGRSRVDWNLVHFLALAQVVEEPNALLGFEVR